MAMRLSLGLVSLLVGAAYAVPAPLVPQSENTHAERALLPEALKMQLMPVANTNRTNTVGRNMAPTKNLNLNWQTPDNAGLVAVALSMQHPAVVLEDVDDVTAVDCTGRASVAVTFADADAFHEALSSWQGLNDSFVMVTNHLGDCDDELERSFFVADTDTLASYEANFTIIAKAEKKDAFSTADGTDINFSKITTPASDVDKRGVDLDKEGLNLAYNYSTPSELNIHTGDHTSIALHEAQVNNSVTYAGHVKWDVSDGVTEFTIDIDKTLWLHADLTFNAAIKLTDSWTWSPPGMTYSVIHIPGVMSLGPSAGVTFGGSITAETDGAITADLTSNIPNGTVHLDFINWNQSTSSGWDSQHDATYNVTEGAKITLKPYVDFTVQFACNLFDGEIDLSTGIKAEPSFPFVTAAPTAAQNFNSTGAMTTPNATCANGLSESVDFKFTIVAFATEWIDKTLYDYTADIYKKCLTW